MRRRWSALMLAGALALLVSLYLPWQQTSCGPACTRARGGEAGGALNDLFSVTVRISGWSSGIGDAAALGALLLAAVAGAALARPHLTDRLPLGFCAVLAGYFALAVAAVSRSVASQQAIETKLVGVHGQYAYGAYLGVTGGIAGLLAAGALRRDELVRRRSVVQLTALALSLGLLVAFLVPWRRLVVPGVTFLGIVEPSALLAAVAVCVTARWWVTDRGRSSSGTKLGASAATALLTAGAVGAVTFGVNRTFGAWAGLGLALALLVLTLLGSAPVSRPALPSRRALVVTLAAVILLAALFMPWQRICYPTASDAGAYSGRCVSTNAWGTLAGSVAGALATLVIAATFALRRRASLTRELAVGIALLATTLGFQVSSIALPGVQLGLGSLIGFGATAVLLLAMADLRRPAFDRHRVLVRLAPMAACLAYLTIVVVPWWLVLPERLQSQSLDQFLPMSWLSVAGALLAIHLLGSWMRSARDPSGVDVRLVLVPLGLLVLAALDIMPPRYEGVTWGGVLVVALCLLLALLGWAEQRGGLERLTLSEALRIDRLGPPEA